MLMIFQLTYSRYLAAVLYTILIVQNQHSLPAGSPFPQPFSIQPAPRRSSPENSPENSPDVSEDETQPLLAEESALAMNETASQTMASMDRTGDNTTAEVQDSSSLL